MPRKKRLLALDMGSNCVKAVEFQVFGGQILATGFGYKSFAVESDRLNSAMEVVESNKFRGANTASAISGRNVITRYITMQRLEPEELRQAIQFEAGKYIPFGIDEVVLDCQKVEDIEGSDQIRVLLAAVKRNVIDDHIHLLDQLGLQPQIIDVEAFAVGNAFLEAMGRKVGSATAAVLDIGHTKTNIIVLRNGKIVFNREVYIGARDFMEAISRRLDVAPERIKEMASHPGDDADLLAEAVAGSLDDLCNEVTLSFEFFENEYDSMIDSVWLGGGGAQLHELPERVSERLGKPTQGWDPLEPINIRLGSAQSEAMKTISRQLAVVVGLGTRVRRDV